MQRFDESTTFQPRTFDPAKNRKPVAGEKPLSSASSEGSKAAPSHQEHQDLDVSSDLQLSQDCNASNSPAKRRSHDRKGEYSGQSAAVSVRRHTKSLYYGLGACRCSPDSGRISQPARNVTGTARVLRLAKALDQEDDWRSSRMGMENIRKKVVGGAGPKSARD